MSSSFSKIKYGAFVFLLNAWFVAITKAIAKGSKTKIKIRIKKFAVFLISQPVISLKYLIAPNSPDTISVDARSKTSKSRLVILSARTPLRY